MAKTVLIFTLALWLLSAKVAIAQGTCGDCNGDGIVTVDEVLTGVNIAMGNASVCDCSAADQNEDGRITVDEILKMARVALVGVVLSGCGGGGSSTPTPSTTPTTIPVNTQTSLPTPTPIQQGSAVELIRSEQLSDGTFRYVLGYLASKVFCDKSAPFAECSVFNGWPPIGVSDSDGDGRWELTITGFNMYDIGSVYGGNFAANCWADISDPPDPDYNADVDHLVFSLVAGVKYRQGEIDPPGDDVLGPGSSFLRGYRTCPTCNTYFLDTNLNQVRGNISAPFLFGDFDSGHRGWETVPTYVRQDLPGAGWTEVGNPLFVEGNQVIFAFGGYFSAADPGRTTWTWADGDFRSDPYYWLPNDAFCVRFENGGIAPCR